MKGDLLVGGFTSPGRGGVAHGVSLLREGVAVAVLPMVDPSWLVRHPSLPDVVYVAHSDAGHVSAMDRGSWTLIGSRATGGHNAAHVACSPDGRSLVASCFGSGHVSVLPIDVSGALMPASCVLELDRSRSPHPQPHQAVFTPDGRQVLVPDRASDCVWLLDFDAATHRVTPADRVDLQRGSGPRHLAWHPTRPLAYLVDELISSVTVLRRHAGGLVPLATHSAVPAGVTSIAAGICVSPDGRHVYLSNRGHDSLAMFAVDGDGLRPIGWQREVGQSPRFITMSRDGRTLWVASHASSEVRAFARDASTGALTERERIASPSAACLLPIQETP